MGKGKFVQVWVPAGKGKGKRTGFSGKGKGKRTIKGKGKGKRAPRVDSAFWSKKEDEENRKSVGSDTFNGTIIHYKRAQGWGFIKPEQPNSLPKNVKAKLEKASKELKAAGKEVANEYAIYFRKPDVNHDEDFKLVEGSPYTFEVYVDTKGAGASNVTKA